MLFELSPIFSFYDRMILEYEYKTQSFVRPSLSVWIHDEEETGELFQIKCPPNIFLSVFFPLISILRVQHGIIPP
jgi:hypothetical protein